MSIICPTVTAVDPHEYRSQLGRLTSFAERIHFDFADDDFASRRLINLIQSYWPDDVTADLHIMYRKPLEHIETIVSLQPSLVIVHAEAEGDLAGMMKHLQELGIKAGVALLQKTQPQDCAELIKIADHVLIFSGDLGHFGGQADLGQLQKVERIQAITPNVEIGWDGGVNAENAKVLADGGVDVLNVGGFIQRAEKPAEAYKTLTALVQEGNSAV